MMKRRRYTATPHYFANLGLGLAVLVILAATGLRFVDFSAAATINPYGYADYCALENNTTIIYGWAADPNATSLTQPLVTINAGGQATTVITGQAGYRDAAINAWIDQNRAGDPKPGTYGFRAPLAGLYKGTRNVITGSVINEGPGTSVILNINTSGPTDGVTGRPYFAGNVIPDVCLANRPPAPPTPPTPPQPATPTPTPTPARPNPTPAAVTPSAPGALSNASSAEVTAGTLAASLKVAAGGAANIRILYGTNPLAPDKATADQPVKDGVATIAITSLEARTTYSYQIVRFDAAGRTTTSPVDTFKTRGFTVAVTFVNAQNDVLKDIPATISVQPKSPKTTDDEGTVQFQDVAAGSHTVSFEYNGQRYEELVTASTAAANPENAALPQAVTVEHTINVSNLPKVGLKQPATPKTESAGIPAALILGLVALVVAVLFAVLRRRNRRYDIAYDNAPPPPLPEYKPSAPPKEQPIDINQYPIVKRPDGAEHMGESLKDMVLRSMAEEAKRRQDSGPDKKP